MKIGKRQATGRENMLTIHILPKKFVSRIYNSFLQIHRERQTTLFSKRAEELNRYITKENVKMINKHMKNF